MKYSWFEHDSGDLGNFTFKYEPKYWGISFGELSYTKKLSNNDDEAGENVIGWDDVNNSSSKGYHYDSDYIHYYIRQK